MDLQTADDWEPDENWVQSCRRCSSEEETTENRPFVVCGWFTPNYIHWVEPLIAYLGRLGHANDFRQVVLPDKVMSWEERTCLKAREISKAMERWPHHWIVFTDVDCRILRPLDGLVNSFGADVGFYIQTKFCRRGGAKIRVRSGTMVFSPTLEARDFVHAWETESGRVPRGEVDQTALQVVLGRQTGAAFKNIPNEFCALEGECNDPVILHSQAGRNAKKVRAWQKHLCSLLGRR